MVAVTKHHIYVTTRQVISFTVAVYTNLHHNAPSPPPHHRGGDCTVQYTHTQRGRPYQPNVHTHAHLRMQNI